MYTAVSGVIVEHGADFTVPTDSFTLTCISMPGNLDMNKLVYCNKKHLFIIDLKHKENGRTFIFDKSVWDYKCDKDLTKIAVILKSEQTYQWYDILSGKKLEVKKNTNNAIQRDIIVWPNQEKTMYYGYSGKYLLALDGKTKRVLECHFKQDISSCRCKGKDKLYVSFGQINTDVPLVFERDYTYRDIHIPIDFEDFITDRILKMIPNEQGVSKSDFFFKVSHNQEYIVAYFPKQKKLRVYDKDLTVLVWSLSCIEGFMFIENYLIVKWEDKGSSGYMAKNCRKIDDCYSHSKMSDCGRYVVIYNKKTGKIVVFDTEKKVKIRKYKNQVFANKELKRLIFTKKPENKGCYLGVQIVKKEQMYFIDLPSGKKYEVLKSEYSRKLKRYMRFVLYCGKVFLFDTYKNKSLGHIFKEGDEFKILTIKGEAACCDDNDFFIIKKKNGSLQAYNVETDTYLQASHFKVSPDGTVFGLLNQRGAVGFYGTDFGKGLISKLPVLYSLTKKGIDHFDFYVGEDEYDCVALIEKKDGSFFVFDCKKNKVLGLGETAFFEDRYIVCSYTDGTFVLFDRKRKRKYILGKKENPVVESSFFISKQNRHFLLTELKTGLCMVWELQGRIIKNVPIIKRFLLGRYSFIYCTNGFSLLLDTQMHEAFEFQVCGRLRFIKDPLSLELLYVTYASHKNELNIFDVRKKELIYELKQVQRFINGFYVNPVHIAVEFASENERVPVIKVLDLEKRQIILVVKPKHFLLFSLFKVSHKSDFAPAGYYLLFRSCRQRYIFGCKDIYSLIHREAIGKYEYVVEKNKNETFMDITSRNKVSMRYVPGDPFSELLIKFADLEEVKSVRKKGANEEPDKNDNNRKTGHKRKRVPQERGSKLSLKQRKRKRRKKKY